MLRKAAGDTLRPGGFFVTDRAAESIGVVPGWRVLDVGSGLGATVGRLRSRFGAEAWGIEPSGGQIGRTVDPSGLVQACGDRLPFRSAVFDAVFCECVFSLFEDKPGGLREFHRVLRPGGHLVLADLFSPEEGLAQGASCADRAKPLSAVRGMAEAHGFRVHVTEDHSRHLRELAARLIFAQDGEDRACCCDRRLGYYLMLAQKQEGSHVG
ncbi:DVU_1556 family methyltransferase [Pseudodesulfovibrio sp. S3]|uniref:DVU_1556 family methyltransferase n=1 Tax=unclassified Pseudodesulfovibrio TaxID=2661612 RepID=UPI001F4F6C84|nr:methyltransferase domain-containing protein [Pseudodesulfovibrio sp. S3]MCJ2164784.1 methyltransferase domain-containing protein [Pseudodesulfovibrio sp. S3-i]